MAEEAVRLEQATAEQERRDGITAEIADFVDHIFIERPKINNVEFLRMNGYPIKPGSVLVSPDGYSIKYTTEGNDYFWFAYDEAAFSITLKRPGGGSTVTEVKSKQPLAEGLTVDQKLPETASGNRISTFSRDFVILKATYGAGQTQRDVKELVKSKLQNRRLDFRAHSGELGGDPAFGHVKTFYIKYVAGGRIKERSFREGEQVSLP